MSFEKMSKIAYFAHFLRVVSNNKKIQVVSSTFVWDLKNQKIGFGPILDRLLDYSKLLDKSNFFLMLCRHL